MQPDPTGEPGPNPESAVFLEKLEAPLKYLRGLQVDEVTGENRGLSARNPASANLVGGYRGGAVLDDAGLAAKSPRGVRDSDSKEGDSKESDAKESDAKDTASELGSGDLSGNSIVRRLEKVLGFAPALDLVPPGEELPEGFGVSDERYSIEGELGAGGMGRVLLVYDQDIRRRVAMKVLRDEVADKKAVTRFLEEAQATGQLEHPNIAPVYDIGIDKTGRVFFTMKLVRGRNLGEISRDLAIGRPEVRQHFTLTRLVQILQQASMGVHYGHVRGVIHRDLKPENVMVGDFGEVLVMDWGLAKISGRQELDIHPDDAIDSFRGDKGMKTLDGTIQGTLAYMSPEQARGWRDEIDERTDVFGLGAILYQLLTFHPPYEGKNVREVLGKAGVGEITPPSERAPRQRIPKSLETICKKALSSSKDDRYQDAKAFHEALQVYLDGTAEVERRRNEAGALVRAGREKISEYRRLAEVETALRQQAQEVLAGVEPHDRAEDKTRSWELEDEADRVRQQRIRIFNEATSSLNSAIHVDESCREAKESLANVYWNRFEEAERAGNLDDMTMYRGLVERYHEGKYQALLEGNGSLQVQSDPADAEVTVYRVEERGRRLVELEGRLLGQTPLTLELPMGHHLLVLRRDGYRDTRCPVFIERCGRLTVRVRLFRDEEIGDSFVYVPAGEVFLGGDPKAPGSLEASKRYVEDVFVSRFPVTFREYCEFLDDLRANDHPELEERIPRTEREGDCVLLGDDGRYRPDIEKLVDLPTRERYPAGFGWRLPVLAVSWTAADHYCKWLSRRSARKIRLPRDAEWEKSARGVARSLHPWGDFFDWSFVKGGSSRPEHPQPEPVGAFEHDRSVYGVQDLAGGIREWCEDWFVDGVGRLIRGGHWGTMTAVAFRAALRTGSKPAMKSSAIGFRVVAEPPARPA